MFWCPVSAVPSQWPTYIPFQGLPFLHSDRACPVALVFQPLHAAPGLQARFSSLLLRSFQYTPSGWGLSQDLVLAPQSWLRHSRVPPELAGGRRANPSSQTKAICQWSLPRRWGAPPHPHQAPQSLEQCGVGRCLHSAEQATGSERGPSHGFCLPLALVAVCSAGHRQAAQRLHGRSFHSTREGKTNTAPSPGAGRCCDPLLPLTCVPSGEMPSR